MSLAFAICSNQNTSLNQKDTKSGINILCRLPEFKWILPLAKLNWHVVESFSSLWKIPYCFTACHQRWQFPFLAPLIQLSFCPNCARSARFINQSQIYQQDHRSRPLWPSNGFIPCCKLYIVYTSCKQQQVMCARWKNSLFSARQLLWQLDICKIDFNFYLFGWWQKTTERYAVAVKWQHASTKGTLFVSGITARFVFWCCWSEKRQFLSFPLILKFPLHCIIVLGGGDFVFDQQQWWRRRLR